MAVTHGGAAALFLRGALASFSRACLIAVLWVGLVAPLPAAAHEVGIPQGAEHGHLLAVLDEVRPRVDGLEVRVLNGVIPGIYVRNDTGRVLAVPGRQGEPFLRIGPDGVHANLASPTYYLAGSQGVRSVPSSADPHAPPRWRRVERAPVYVWLEYAGRVPEREKDPRALGPRRRTLLRWTTRATLDGEPLDVRGHVDWVPAAAASPTNDGISWASVALSATIGGIAAAALAWYRNARRRKAALPSR